MTYENIILGAAIYMLFYDHLPHWGGWFNAILKRLPKPLQTLYEQWRCPYCVGFWIGLVLHVVTGNWLFASFEAILPSWGAAGLVVGWVFDALCFAILNKFAVLAVNAVSYPAMLTYEKKEAFMQKMAAKSAAADES
ncbi:hypothetical protein [Celeribacter sp.]|uniref:hypothetical protein n=1 Tax=Celeribacter sp. TaxID=1890673 RepID=UPI003A8D2AFE